MHSRVLRSRREALHTHNCQAAPIIAERIGRPLSPEQLRLLEVRPGKMKWAAHLQAAHELKQDELISDLLAAAAEALADVNALVSAGTALAEVATLTGKPPESDVLQGEALAAIAGHALNVLRILNTHNPEAMEAAIAREAKIAESEATDDIEIAPDREQEAEPVPTIAEGDTDPTPKIADDRDLGPGELFPTTTSDPPAINPDQEREIDLSIANARAISGRKRR